MERYLTTDEVADALRTTPATVAYWRGRGTGPQGVRVGKRVLYPESSVRRWVAELAEAQATACDTPGLTMQP